MLSSEDMDYCCGVLLECENSGLAGFWFDTVSDHVLRVNHDAEGRVGIHLAIRKEAAGDQLGVPNAQRPGVVLSVLELDLGRRSFAWFGSSGSRWSGYTALGSSNLVAVCVVIVVYVDGDKRISDQPVVDHAAVSLASLSLRIPVDDVEQLNSV